VASKWRPIIRNDAFHVDHTFVRTSKAWGFDSSGNLVEYAPNTPRFVYDPVTGEARGFLSEVQRIQLVLRTECRQGASPDGEAINCTLDNLSGDYLGEFRGCRATSTGSATGGWQSRGFTVTGGVTYCYSAVFAAGTSPQARIRLTRVGVGASDINGNIGSLAVTSTAGGAMTILRQVQLATGEWLVQGTWVPVDTGSATMRISMNSATVGEDIIAIAAQVEAGSVPTSLIISDGLATTRTRDECVVNTADIAGWNPNGGVFVLEYNKEFAEVSNGRLLESSTGQSILRQDSGTGLIRVGGTNSAVPFVGTHRIAVAVGAGAFRASVDSGAVTTWTGTTNVASWTGLSIGSSFASFTNHANAEFKLLNYLPSPSITDAQLQVLSS